VQTHVELIERIKAHRVASSVAVGMVVVRKAEDGIGGLHTLQDRVLQRGDRLIAGKPDALLFGSAEAKAKAAPLAAWQLSARRSRACPRPTGGRKRISSSKRMWPAGSPCAGRS